MRTVPTDLATEVASATPRLAFGIIVQRADGLNLCLTSADRDDLISGVPVNGVATGSLTYSAQTGVEVSNVRSTEGFGVDTLEGTLLEGGLVTRADVLRGLWDGAAWTLFQYNWADTDSPITDIMVLKSGHLGNINPRIGQFIVELRDLRQPLNEEHSLVLQADCRYNLGDARCTKSLAAFTDTVTVTGVTSSQVFTISSARADDFFGNGSITWLTGNNAGVSVKVKSYNGTTDTFTLAAPMLSAIQVGDTATAIAGCRKRRTEDCATKFANVLNFGGEPDKPKIADVVAEPDVNAPPVAPPVVPPLDP